MTRIAVVRIAAVQRPSRAKDGQAARR
jgi:hypothetical protein